MSVFPWHGGRETCKSYEVIGSDRQFMHIRVSLSQTAVLTDGERSGAESAAETSVCEFCQILSGSSDGTIKLWSLGQQRCIGTIRIHNEGVWTLATKHDSPSCFGRVYSSGRDARVVCTNLHEPAFEHYVVCRESAPVLRVSHRLKSVHSSPLLVFH